MRRVFSLPRDPHALRLYNGADGVPRTMACLGAAELRRGLSPRRKTGPNGPVCFAASKLLHGDLARGLFLFLLPFQNHRRAVAGEIS